MSSFPHIVIPSELLPRDGRGDDAKACLADAARADDAAGAAVLGVGQGIHTPAAAIGEAGWAEYRALTAGADQRLRTGLAAGAAIGGIRQRIDAD